MICNYQFEKKSHKIRPKASYVEQNITKCCCCFRTKTKGYKESITKFLVIDSNLCHFKWGEGYGKMHIQLLIRAPRRNTKVILVISLFFIECVIFISETSSVLMLPNCEWHLWICLSKLFGICHKECDLDKMTKSWFHFF